MAFADVSARYGSISGDMSTLEYVAIWAGIIGLVPAYSFEYSWNILTPQVQTWWAKTSVTRRKRHIQRLLKDLEDCRNCDKVSWRIDQIGRVVKFIAFGLAALAYSSILGPEELIAVSKPALPLLGTGKTHLLGQLMFSINVISNCLSVILFVFVYQPERPLKSAV